MWLFRKRQFGSSTTDFASLANDAATTTSIDVSSLPFCHLDRLKSAACSNDLLFAMASLDEAPSRAALIITVSAMYLGS